MLRQTSMLQSVPYSCPHPAAGSGSRNKRGTTLQSSSNRRSTAAAAAAANPLPALISAAGAPRGASVPKTSSPSPSRDRLRSLPNAPVFPSQEQCVATGDRLRAVDDGNGKDDLTHELTDSARMTSPEDNRRLRFLECSIVFLKNEHQEILTALQRELDKLKSENNELQLRLVMAEDQVLLNKRRSAFERNRKEEMRLKREAEASEQAAANYCIPIDRVGVSVPPATGTAWVEVPQSSRVQPPGARVCCESVGQPELQRQQLKPVVKPMPKRSSPVRRSDTRQSHGPKVETLSIHRSHHLIQQQQQRTVAKQQNAATASAPSTDSVTMETVTKCQEIIRQLKTENERLSRELNQLRTNVRGVIRGQSQRLPANRLLRGSPGDISTTATNCKVASTERNNKGSGRSRQNDPRSKRRTAWLKQKF